MYSLSRNGPKPAISVGGVFRSHALANLAVVPGLFEQMTRKNIDAIKHAFGGCVGLRQPKSDVRRIDFFYADRLAANDQKIALGRVHGFIQIRAESENDIVGIHGMAVGKAQPAPELQDILSTIARYGPGFSHAGLGFERTAIDGDQVRHHAANHIARRHVEGGYRIQRLRLGAFQYDQGAPIIARFAFSY